MYKQVPKLSQPPTFQLITPTAGNGAPIEVQMSYGPQQSIKSIVSMNPDLVVDSFTSDTTDVTIILSWGPNSSAGAITFQLRVTLDDGRQYFSNDLTCVKTDTCTLTLTYIEEHTSLGLWISINGTKYTSSTTLEFPFGTEVTIQYIGPLASDAYVYAYQQINDGRKFYVHKNWGMTVETNLTLDTAIHFKFVVSPWIITPNITAHNGTVEIRDGFTDSYGLSTDRFRLAFIPATGYEFEKFVWEHMGETFDNGMIGYLGDYVPLGWAGATSAPPNNPEDLQYLTGDAYGKLISYTVEISQKPYQTIKVTTQDGVEHTESFTAPYGTTYTVSVTPDAGYNAGTPSVSSGTITGELTITATSATIKTFQVNITQSENQTITVNVGSVEYTSTFTANYNTAYLVKVTPAVGYTAGTPSVSSGTITGDLTITATPAVVTQYEVTLEQPANGTISAEYNGTTYTSGSITVSHGDTVTFTCTPNEGYVIYNWTKNGTAIT